MNKRDILLLLGGLLIIVVLWMAPEESTTRVPRDQDHLRFYTIVKKDGKKAAEKFCLDCHNADGVPFPKDHPPKNRCLLCHKMRFK
ncbi:MAG: cytochrome c [Deltaproteobacteria bacterium]|nr:cytochrome c [Deltaproteobacteria bacterium]